MVKVTSLLAPRLSRLIVDTDLDMKNYRILNAVLGSGNKLGADLDAQNYRILNAVLGGASKLGADLDAQNYRILNAALNGAKLTGDLNAQGNKVLNLTVDDQNPTSAVNMAALLDAIYPSISYDKYLCWASEQVPPLLISGYLTGSRRILNPKPDYGILIRSNAVETANTIVYYHDVRHSHDLDTQDTTPYSVSGTTPTSVLSYDYGSVLNVKELYLIISLWVGGGTGTITVEGSNDGSTWTQLWSQSTSSGTETIHRVIVRNTSFRYLRFVLVNNGVSPTYTKIRKIVITI